MYGATGNPDYPYHPRRGSDAYYDAAAAKMSNDEIVELFKKAKAGLDEFERYARVMAMRGDLAAVKALDALYDELRHGQHPEGFGAYKKTGYTGR